MIKDVFNSITTSSGSDKLSSFEQLIDSKKGNNDPGFFGKMLLALQNEGEGNTESGETESIKTESGEAESGSLENEDNQLRSFKIVDSKSGDETAELISNENDQEVEKEKSDQEEILVTETFDEPVLEKPDTSAEGDRIKNAMISEEDSSVSVTQEQKVSDLDRNSALNLDSSPADTTERSPLVGGNEDEKTIASNNFANTEGAVQSKGQNLNDAVPDKTKESARNYGRSENLTPADKPSEQGRTAVSKEGNIQNQSIGISGSEGEKNLQIKPEQVANGQNSSAAGTVPPKVKADAETLTEMNNPQQKTQAEPENGAKRRFFDLNRPAKTEPMPLRNTMADNSAKIQTQDHSTVRLDQRGEQVNRDLSVKVNPTENPQLQAELNKAQKINEDRAKRYDLFNQNTDAKSSTGDRLGPVASGAGSGSNHHGMGFSAQPNWIQYQANNQQQASFTDIQEVLLNEQILESAEATENGTSEQAKLSMNRLSEMPINNVILKRTVLPGLTGALKSATSAGKQIPQSWQKHSFDLDDGNKIELSTRNVDGVIQVKIATSSIELSKLMQEYGQEIKDHLEQECELDIDLQFDNKENETTAGFSDNFPSSGNGERKHSASANETKKIMNKKAEEHLQQTVRKFGYNQMEWTI